MTKKACWTLLIFMAALSLPVTPISGSVIAAGDDIQFTPLHHIDDDVYAFANQNNLSMDGQIDGDFTAFAYDISINGEITGTANLGAYNVNHNGRIDGSVRAFVQAINISGIVGRSVVTFCNSFILSRNGLIERDLHAFCGSANIGGTVKGNVHVMGGEVRILGVIEGDVDLKADRIIISPPAVIKGNLTYECDTEARIDTAGGVVILGTTEWIKPDDIKATEDSGTLRNTVVSLAEMVAAFLFGLLLLVPFRRYAKEALEQLRSRFVVSLAAGFLTIIVFALAIVVTVLSAISFLIGYGLISGDVPAAGALVLILSTIILPLAAFGTVSGGILFYIGKIILAFLVGFMVVKLLRKEAAQLSKIQLLLGLVILVVIFAIPYLGALLYILGSMTGAGAIILAIRRINFEISGAKIEKSADSAPPEDSSQQR